MTNHTQQAGRRTRHVVAKDGTELVYNEIEWTAFRKGIANREFDSSAVFAGIGEYHN